jgi:hypothetical protein
MTTLKNSGSLVERFISHSHPGESNFLINVLPQFEVLSRDFGCFDASPDRIGAGTGEHKYVFPGFLASGSVKMSHLVTF